LREGDELAENVKCWSTAAMNQYFGSALATILKDLPNWHPWFSHYLLPGDGGSLLFPPCISYWSITGDYGRSNYLINGQLVYYELIQNYAGSYYTQNHG
jgi:hypothetical protein